MIGDNIWQNTLLRNILIVFLSLATVLPLYNVLFIYPSFTNLLIESTKNDAVSVAKHLASILISEKSGLDEESLLADLIVKVHELKINFELERLKIFSKSGEIIFSTDPKDIGNVNKQKYFQEVVNIGKVHSEFINRDSRSLEGRKMTADVVETYVPLISGGQVLGAFEIYYNITARKKQLDRIRSRSTVTVFILAFGLSMAIIILLFKENKNIAERKRAQEKREKMIAELRDALARINTLSGLLPICAHCKKIRDDKGYWKQIESYIREHSKAEFSHSICPECAKKFYPDLFDEE